MALGLAKPPGACVCAHMKRTPIEIAIDGDQAGLCRVARYAARQRAKGLLRVTTAVPEGRKADLQAFAAKLRAEAGFE